MYSILRDTTLAPIPTSRAFPFTGQRWLGSGSDKLKMASQIAPSAAACAAEFATILFAIRISVRPVAVSCTTMKPISTSVQSTIISAKPLSVRPAAGQDTGSGTDPQARSHWLIADRPRIQAVERPSQRSVWGYAKSHFERKSGRAETYSRLHVDPACPR